MGYCLNFADICLLVKQGDNKSWLLQLPILIWNFLSC